MATETVPDIATHHEHDVGKETEEVKAVEQDIVSSSKSEELATPTASASELEENTEDKKIHQPAVTEVGKVDSIPGLDVPAENNVTVTENTLPVSDVSLISEPAVTVTEKETEGHSTISDVPEPAVESVEKPLDSPPTQEPGPEVETKLGEVSEESKIVEKPESTVVPEVEKEPEVLQSEFKKVENPESAAEESEIGKQMEASGSESKVPESVVKVEDKPQEQSENVEEVEKTPEQLELKENTEVEPPKEEGVLVESSIEKDVGNDPLSIPCESSETFTFETPSVPIEEVVSVIPEAAKEAPFDVPKAEEEKLEKIVKVEESKEPETIDTEKPLEDKASRDVEVVTGEKEDENANNDIPASVETTKDVESLIAKTEDIAEKSFGEPETSKDAEVVTEEKKEEDATPVAIIKDTEPDSTETEGETTSKDIAVATEEKKEESDKPDSSVETRKDTNLEEKVEASEPVGELKEVELEPVETAEAATSKDTDDSRTNEDASKEEVLPKPAQKQSSSLISKVKHSIVKVKKAIIGKSPSSKTMTADAKGDIKVK